MSFNFWKKNGVIYFEDNGGYESRNDSTIWCIKRANEIYNWEDFKPLKIYTGDFEKESSDYTYSKINSTFRTVPDFNFHAWPEVGIEDYNKLILEIDSAGLTKPEYNKVGWIGTINTVKQRKDIYNLSKEISYMDIIPITWSKSDNIKLNSNKYISTPNLVKKYSILIDIEGNGYSARVKHLLWSHRPLIIVDRKHKEFFFEKLKPWEHYIPVKHDLSDLLKNINWCLENEKDAKRIAENAYNFSKKYLTREACYSRWNEIILDNKIL